MESSSRIGLSVRGDPGRDVGVLRPQSGRKESRTWDSCPHKNLIPRGSGWELTKRSIEVRTFAPLHLTESVWSGGVISSQVNG